ncbi:ABC transporter substrate-binding protein [Neorhizobium galegae]|uniref:Extracellular solute-binding protein family 5 n=1 Tax=Neorhizobium galegae bv. orientalis str. HAMBI 540 TaxID=1028800 RepID=A0A068T0N4_NEOGA|nr:ABC transporter substrate-binding protein [Neorhizobium galegae]MCQ1854587.1 ABC transporter substrate-binding protein [Neorhizobium galegae]CDN51943.1 Extracellular solute-binding protein family 5 [Neorhizobium galegae bv. orientalis str. HAMBI 540]CDZ51537.1 Extracellular solute-binding protein, family 5 middle family protein 21 [Neorhizobium galegae bv. orientalis]
MILRIEAALRSCVAACLVATALAAPVLAAEGAIVLALPSEPTSMDACDDSTNANARVLRGNVVEGLTRLSPDGGGEVIPLLATEWKRVDDNNWLFTLRDGVKFHDGTPLDADAAVYGINRMMSAELNCNTLPLFKTPTSASVEGKMVKITTKTPDPILPARMAYVDLPSPKTAKDKKSTQPIGTGPYKFVSREPGQSIVLQASDSYWGKPVDFAKATYVWRGEATIRASMVKTREADIAIDIPFHEADGQQNAQEYSTNSVFFIRPMMLKPPLNDLRVRQALAHAIDKDTLTEVLMEKAATPASQLVSPLINGNIPGFRGLPFDVDKAKKLLADAKATGVPVDTRIELISRADLFAGIGEVSQAIQQMLKNVGFNVNLVTVDSVAWSPWARKPDSANQPVNLLTVTHDNVSGDASLSFPTYFGSEARLSMASDADLNKRLEQAGTLVGQARIDAYRAISKTAYEQQIILPIAALQSRLLTSSKVTYKANGFTDIEIHLADVTRK